MKNNGRKVLAALALTLALTPAALAGAMYTDVAPPPPPPPAVAGIITTEAAAGIMSTDATDTLTEMALSLVAALTRL